jgi:hypothetical protein
MLTALWMITFGFMGMHATSLALPAAKHASRSRQLKRK